MRCQWAVLAVITFFAVSTQAQTVADFLAAATPPPGTAVGAVIRGSGEAGIKANGVALVAFRSISGDAVLDGSFPANSFGNFLVATVDRPPGLSEIAWVATSNILGVIPGHTVVSGQMFVEGVDLSDLEFLYQVAGGPLISVPIMPEPLFGAGALLLLLSCVRRRIAPVG